MTEKKRRENKTKPQAKQNTNAHYTSTQTYFHALIRKSNSINDTHTYNAPVGGKRS